MIKNYGFKAPIIEDDHYIFGAMQLPMEVLQPDGQWDAYLPVDELQNRGKFETYNCTNYGTLHAIATLFFRKFKERNDYSERFTGVMTGTEGEGNDPHTVAEIIRKTCGLIPESELPFTDALQTVQEYFSPKPMIEPYLTHGKQWLEKYKLSHEWVFLGYISNKNDLMMEALKFSPLGADVYAWVQNVGGLYYKPTGSQSNHWITIYGFEEDKFWKCFDSYDNTHKKLAWDFDFTFVKKYYLEKLQEKKTSKLKKFVEILKSFFTKIEHYRSLPPL